MTAAAVPFLQNTHTAAPISRGKTACERQGKESLLIIARLIMCQGKVLHFSIFPKKEGVEKKGSMSQTFFSTPSCD
jgi:hypothetical protein